MFLSHIRKLTWIVYGWWIILVYVTDENHTFVNFSPALFEKSSVTVETYNLAINTQAVPIRKHAIQVNINE